MTRFHDRSSIVDVLAQRDARAVIERIAPQILESPLASDGITFPIGRVLPVMLEEGDPRVDEILAALRELEDRTERPVELPPVVPRDDYERDDVDSASATIRIPEHAEQWQRAEITVEGPGHGNPFVDVDLRATFLHDGSRIEVAGFYDGDGTYRIRFLPSEPGTWTFRTQSNARSLDGLTGAVEVLASERPGPVRVDGNFHFAHADGTRFAPFGTTAYVWTMQDHSLQEETLRSLESAPFNKLRMGLFPKHFPYNANEPERFPFPRTDEGWDTERFDIEYFRALERRIDQLDALGIQADLILFHPYDRWGFASLGKAADDRYVSYVVRRLASFTNVWWSLANEYDLLLSKEKEDWDRIASVVRENDPVGHLLSIHNWVDIWDFTSTWATHCSVQWGAALYGSVRAWRRQWGKPVVVDELGYEGDLEHGWGNLTAQEEVRRSWEVALAGGYPTHGETFWSADEVVFWAKGGTLRGASPARLRFLQSVVAESPTGALAPLRSDFDTMVGGVEGQYIITYFGGSQPRLRTVIVPDGMRAEIDVIDTWNMTINTLAGEHSGAVTVDLPARPYVAVRVRALD
jgi:hypothetical protein